MRTFYPLFFAALVIASTSCAPSYVLNNVNAPLLYQKKDYMAGANLNGQGLGLQGAYATTDHLGVMANVLVNPFGSDTKYYFGEVGGGYYTTIGDNVHFELYGGTGWGYGKATGEGLWSDDEISEEGSYWRIFAQPDIGFHSKYFELALAGRLVHVQYLDFKSDGMPAPNPDSWILEPSLVMRFGFGGQGFFENKKLFLQLTAETEVFGVPEFDTPVLNLGIGIIYRNRGYDNNFIN